MLMGASETLSKSPYALPELELLRFDGDALTASGGDPDGDGWGQVFPIG